MIAMQRVVTVIKVTVASNSSNSSSDGSGNDQPAGSKSPREKHLLALSTPPQSESQKKTKATS